VSNIVVHKVKSLKSLTVACIYMQAIRRYNAGTEWRTTTLNMVTTAISF